MFDYNYKYGLPVPRSEVGLWRTCERSDWTVDVWSSESSSSTVLSIWPSSTSDCRRSQSPSQTSAPVPKQTDNITIGQITKNNIIAGRQ